MWLGPGSSVSDSPTSPLAGVMRSMTAASALASASLLALRALASLTSRLHSLSDQQLGEARGKRRESQSSSVEGEGGKEE